MNLHLQGSLNTDKVLRHNSNHEHKQYQDKKKSKFLIRMNKCAHLISHTVEGQHTRMRYGTVLGTSCKDRFKKRTFINLDLKQRGIKKKKKKKNLPCFQARSATGIVQQLWKYPSGQMVTTSPPRST